MLTFQTVVSLNRSKDRRTVESSKRKGRGLAGFMNKMWWNLGYITVKEQLCSRDIKLLASSIAQLFASRTESCDHATCVPPPPLLMLLLQSRCSPPYPSSRPSTYKPLSSLLEILIIASISATSPTLHRLSHKEK